MSVRGLPQTKFVILASPRCGSNLLCNSLNLHPEILCHNEIFHPSTIFAYGRDKVEHAYGTVDERDRDPKAFLRKIWSDHQGHAAVGFKLQHYQGRSIQLGLLLNRSVRKIILHRRNRLAAFVSLLRARKTGIWAGRSGQKQSYRDAKVTVDALVLRRFARRNRLYIGTVKTLLTLTMQGYLFVWYEDLHDDAVRGEILSFLGVTNDVGLVQAQLQKQSSKPLRNRIANAEALEKRVRGTKFAAELDRMD